MKCHIVIINPYNLYVLIKYAFEPKMIKQACNSSTQKTEVEDHDFEATLNFIWKAFVSRMKIITNILKVRKLIVMV